jgi:hypothetical protein
MADREKKWQQETVVIDGRRWRSGNYGASRKQPQQWMMTVTVDDGNGQWLHARLGSRLQQGRDDSGKRDGGGSGVAMIGG